MRKNIRYYVAVVAIILIVSIAVVMRTDAGEKKIPDNVFKCYTTIEIKEGDTLWKLADRYSDPKYIRLHLLGNEVQWTDDEFTIIKRNLSNNVSKFCQSSLVSKMDSFRKTDMLQFIYDAKTYIETLPTERKQQMAEAYAELNIFLEKDSFDKSIENGLLSEQSSDVSNSIKQIESSIRFHGVSQNIDYLSLVLDRALLVQCKHTHQYF